MRRERRVITLNDFEHRLLVGGLNTYRNALLNDGKPTDDLNELLLKILDAPAKGGKAEREGR